MLRRLHVRRHVGRGSGTTGLSAAPPTRALRYDDGFSLAELVIAAAILLFIAMALLTMIGVAQRQAIISKERAAVMNATASYMEWVRGQSFTAIGTGPSANPTGTITGTTTIAGQYTVQITPTITWVQDTGIPGTEDYKRVLLQAHAVRTFDGAEPLDYQLESLVSSVGIR